MIENEGYKLADRIPLLISFLSIYILVAGTSYTLGYWALFPINIFDFIGVVDIAKSSIPGLMISVLVVSSQLVFRIFFHDFSNELAPVEESKFTTLLIKYKKIILILFTFIPTCLYAFMDPWPSYVIKYHDIVTSAIWFFAFLSAITVYIYFVSNGYIRVMNTRKYIMGVTIISLVFVPFASFAVGFGKAANIIKGVRYSYVLPAVITDGIKSGELERYLGFYGGKYLLWEPNGRLVRVVSGEKELSIKTFDFESVQIK
ncbi:hypothetical protein NHU86_12135 [Aeromonas caviae]|uniref:hypothetical protein n=1 Tax=Aeromonas caviae TaxID=648 RepID=UPI0030814128|nr:hypothetical protein NHU86_12135 [Aeromonas caviae]